MKEVAVGIIRKRGKVLTCQRKPKAHYPLKWEFPGGKVEPGESPQNALVRELHEELGIDAMIKGEFHRQECSYGDASYRVYYYAVAGHTGEPVNKAFHDMRWVEPRSMLEMDILEGNRDAILKLIDGDQAFETEQR